MLAAAKHPDFTPHVVKPKVKSAKKKKIKSIAELGLQIEIVEAYEKYGMISAAYLQMKLKMSFKEAEEIVKRIQEYLSEH